MLHSGLGWNQLTSFIASIKCFLWNKGTHSLIPHTIEFRDHRHIVWSRGLKLRYLSILIKVLFLAKLRSSLDDILTFFFCYCSNPTSLDVQGPFLSLAWSKLRLCSANHRPGYWSNLACDWPSTAWACSEQETENGPWSTMIRHQFDMCNIDLYMTLKPGS